MFISKGGKCLFSLFQENIRLAFIEKPDGVGDVFTGPLGASLSFVQ